MLNAIRASPSQRLSHLRGVEGEQDQLSKEAEHALKIVTTWLTAHPFDSACDSWKIKGTENPDLKAALCRGSFARAKGIAFFQQTKTAKIISRATGKGFVVANLGWRESRPIWSAPCFLSIKIGGFGVSWGTETITSCYLIHTPEALDQFTRGKVILSAEGHRTDKPTVMEEEMNWAEKNEDEVQIFSYSEGKMLDVSLAGGIMSPAAENQSIYGLSMQPASILSGKVAAPPEFDPIYEILDNLAVEGSQMLKMLQHEGVHVYPVYHSQASYLSSQC